MFACPTVQFAGSSSVEDDDIAAIVDADGNVLEWRELVPGAFQGLPAGHVVVLSMPMFNEMRKFVRARTH